MSIVISIAAEMYVMQRDYSLSATLQSRLSYYLSCLEGNTLPNFPCTTTHLMNHFYMIIFFAGPIHGFTAFNMEHLYRYTKKCVTHNRTIILSANKRELVKTLAVRISYQSSLKRIKLKIWKRDIESFLGGNLEAMKDQALRNLVDDDICFSNSNKIHKTYIECIMDKTEEEWKSNYALLLEEYQESWSVECCIYRLSGSGLVLEAVGQQEKKAPLSAL